MQKILLTMALALILAGCGRKGPLIPPESLLPAPVYDLLATQMGENFQLSWSTPTTEEGGRALKDLAGFRLFKREVLPPEEDCESCPNAYRLLRSVDLEYLQDIRRVGNRLYLNDADVAKGTTYQYKVVSFLKDSTPSRDSNKARLKKVIPPAPPQLKALFSVTGVLLRWERGVAPANTRVIGCNIYRRREDAPPALVPLNDTPVPGSEYADLHLERGVTYTYTIRTVAELEGERMESEPSKEVKGKLAEPD